MRDAKTLKPVKPQRTYLVTHPGPNRALRRRVAALRWIAQKRMATWRRELIRAGIDPDQVLLQRKIKAQLREQIEQRMKKQETEEKVANG